MDSIGRLRILVRGLRWFRGKDLRFQRRSYPLADLLEATRDRDVLDQLKDYEEGCRLLTEVTL